MYTHEGCFHCTRYGLFSRFCLYIQMCGKYVCVYICIYMRAVSTLQPIRSCASLFFSTRFCLYIWVCVKICACVYICIHMRAVSTSTDTVLRFTFFLSRFWLYILVYTSGHISNICMCVCTRGLFDVYVCMYWIYMCVCVWCICVYVFDVHVCMHMCDCYLMYMCVYIWCTCVCVYVYMYLMYMCVCIWCICVYVFDAYVFAVHVWVLFDAHVCIYLMYMCICIWCICVHFYVCKHRILPAKVESALK